MNLRHEARQALVRATAELACQDDFRIRYAALELRLAMEALTYDRAQAYRREIPPEEYETWQPRKVLGMLLEIDPDADRNSTLRLGVESEYGETPREMPIFGTETVLNLKTLKKHYDALGSYLHMPIGKQFASGNSPDFDKARRRCEEIAAMLDAVLTSSAFNVTLGNFAEIECARCGKPVRKRLVSGKNSVDASCFHCGAGYAIHNEGEGDGQVQWEPQHQQFPCPTEGCDEKVLIWRDEFEVGTGWTCPACGRGWVICHGVRPKDDENQMS